MIPDGAVHYELAPMELARAVTVRGRALDAAGMPIAGAKVVGTCEGNVCRPIPGTEAVTDDRGAFRLPSGFYNTVAKGQPARLLIRLADGAEYEASTVPKDDGVVTVKLSLRNNKPTGTI
jgi:hypothetical protein